MLPIASFIAHWVVRTFWPDHFTSSDLADSTTVTIQNRTVKYQKLQLNFWQTNRTIFHMNKTLIRPNYKLDNSLHGLFWKRNLCIFQTAVYLMALPNMENWLTAFWSDCSLAILTKVWQDTQGRFSSPWCRRNFYKACFIAVYYKLCFSYNVLINPVRDGEAYLPLYEFVVNFAETDPILKDQEWPTMELLHGQYSITPDCSGLRDFRNLNITISKYLGQMGHQVVIPHAMPNSRVFRKSFKTCTLITCSPQEIDFPKNILLTEINNFSSKGTVFSPHNLQFVTWK